MEFGVEAHDVVFHFGRTRSLRLLGVLSKVVVAVSNALAADLAHHVDPAKLRVVYHAAEVNELPAREPPDPDAPLQVAMLGYMSPGKGQDQAVQAIGKLRAQGVDARLALVGSGISSYVETLESICRELNVDDRVELIGFVGDERFRYFAAADVALCCSEHEGLPRVVIEAMKCGCAVIGARSGGTEELIDEGRTGYLYRPHDVSDLAAKLALVSQDRARTAALGANAAAWARTRFTRERYAADFLRAANDAVADGDCSPRGTA
jgi:glycosyltransferase involved in cell wall biosynthesis